MAFSRSLSHTQNLAQVTVEALLADTTQDVTFEVLDVRKSQNPDYPDWRKIIREDLNKTPPLSKQELSLMSRPPPLLLSTQEKAEEDAATAAGGAKDSPTPLAIEFLEK